MVLLSIVTSTAKEPSTKSNPILIIEDSLAIIMSIKEFLNALGYYEIKSATTGKEGMQLFENNIKKKNYKEEQKIDSVLKTTYVTLPRIAKLCNISREKALAYLKELESSGKVLCSNNVEEISCNSCSSVMIEKDSDSETTADYYHCLRCNNRFETSKAKKMTTQAFRIKAQYN